jgi:hypothetical protein
MAPAAAGEDYQAQSGTLTFAPNETSKTVTILVNGDATVEPGETFNVNLSNATSASISDNRGVGTIQDDDSAVATFTINDVTQAEGNTGTTNFVFTVTKSGSTSQTATVNFATADNTAMAPTDYTSQSGTLTFAPAETVKTITVQVIGDTAVEPDETFFVFLTNPSSNAAIVDNQGVGTITDDDFPFLTINDVSVSEDATPTQNDPGTRSAVFTVTKGGAATTQTVTVTFATADGTATAGADYAQQMSTLTFAPNETSKTITVPIAGDALDENNETFFVNLSNAMNARIADDQGVGTIIDNEGTPTISVNDVSVTEGDSGTVDATFTVSLSNTSASQVTVDFATADGTASASNDYAAQSGPISFGPGETTKTVAVPVIGDTADEVDETFSLRLSNAANATIAKAEGIGTIIDNDAAPTISISDAPATPEGNSGSTNAVFTVTLSNGSSSSVTVNYATADGTATAGADYTSTAATLTFESGQTTRNITVPVLSDTTDEPDETFFVNLSDATNSTIADGQGIGTITDDDEPAPSPSPSASPSASPSPTVSPGPTVSPSPTASPSPSVSPTASPSPSASPSPTPTRFQNISTRERVGTGENVLIGGFIITGDQPKTVVLRAIGPSLTSRGVAGPLLDPVWN